MLLEYRVWLQKQARIYPFDHGPMTFYIAMRYANRTAPDAQRVEINQHPLGVYLPGEQLSFQQRLGPGPGTFCIFTSGRLSQSLRGRAFSGQRRSTVKNLIQEVQNEVLANFIT